MKDPNEFRSYSTEKLEEARKWRQIAETAFQHARLCEDAGREAADLAKIRDEFLPDKQTELAKIEDRFQTRTARLPKIDGTLIFDRKACADLMAWFNTHTNYSGPGPTSPPEVLYEEGTLWPR